MKRLSIFAALLVAVLVGVSAVAQSATIKGKVRDAQTKDHLPFANVLLVNTGLGSSTDKEGNYIIRNVPAGSYIIRASYIGYRAEETKIAVPGDATIEKDFLLSPAMVEGEVITVTAQAEGQQKAINEQLNSISVKNVVSHARIQELPDANAAESVSRLPGVSLIRTGGEGAQVVIRGLSPQYNRVTIDGVELPANVASSDPNEHRTEFRGGDELSLSGDRASDLSMISSGMLGGIEVIKAITPDMDATVIGGVVNFSMRKAVRTAIIVPRFEFLTQGRHNRLKDTYNDYKLEGSYEHRFREDKIGVFLQGVVEDKNLSANELTGDYLFSIPGVETTDEGQAAFISMNLTDVLRDRDRYGATLVLDYAHETGDFGFMNFFSRSKTRTISRNEFWDGFNDDLFYNATNSNTTLDVYSNLLSLKQTLAGIGIDARLSHSYSETRNPEDVRFNFWQNTAGFAGQYLATRYAPPSDIASIVVHDPENAVFFDIYNVGNLSKDRTLNGAVDFTTELAISGLVTSKIKFGGSYQRRSRSYDYNQSSGSVFYDDGGQVAGAIRREYPQFGDDITFADFVDSDYSYGDFLKGAYKLGPPLDVDLMLKVIEVAKRNPGTGNGGGYKPHKLSSLLYDYSGHENRSAGYTMVTMNVGPWLTVVPGVRYQNLTTEYKGIRGEQIPGSIQYTEADETQSHGYWLPMGHLRLKPLDWMQFHFAYTNTLNYPDYNTIIPRYLIGTNYILYNNYRLKPGRSENFDAMLTFYANEIGLFSIGGFRKYINDLILPSKSFPSSFSAYPELEEKLRNRKEKFTLHTYVNSSQPIDIYGMETEWQTNFWYLPRPLNGVVLNINYTHIFSEAKYPKTFLVSYLDENFIQRTRAIDTTYADRLLNQPNDIMNISVGYDLGGFSARASMLYQDNIFKRPDFWFQNRVHSDKYVRFDLSVKQQLPWFGLQLYFNLNNITGENDVDINQVTGFPTYYQRYGMTAEAGVRVKL